MHLQLKLRVANDETLKRHLASRLKDSTQLNTALTHRLSQLEEAYQRAQQSNEQIMQDNQGLHEEKRRMVEQLRMDEQKRMNEEKQRMLAEHGEVQARCDQEKRELMARHEVTVREMQAKIDRERDIQREMAEKQEGLIEEQRRLRREENTATLAKLR
jgi:spindle assembly abnormal protein 6